MVTLFILQKSTHRGMIPSLLQIVRIVEYQGLRDGRMIPTSASAHTSICNRPFQLAANWYGAVLSGGESPVLIMCLRIDSTVCRVDICEGSQELC